jgi:hypothetical protein
MYSPAFVLNPTPFSAMHPCVPNSQGHTLALRIHFSSESSYGMSSPANVLCIVHSITFGALLHMYGKWTFHFAMEGGQCRCRRRHM